MESMSKEETGAKASKVGEEKSPYVNEVSLTGHCDDAPKAVKTAKGALRAAFSMTIPRGNEKTFVRVVAWDAAAKQCALAPKGGLLHVGGRLRSWRRQEEGATTQLEIVADEVQVLGAPAQQEMASV
jgi:single-stranded DNA-binding protein